ncbi:MULTISPECIES: hypothetical protein [Pseudomonas]|uniref:Lipoprotein n=1 Tax=Pseudomonas eucalypticola TaxID=2599595 RepID=A0A7D5H6Z8_9PSED|nr:MULTISPECIES: hypothetical protein [Pseudomonas]QKZ07202.1 hypothetical protein HWQ56_26850 [Pseudomonas eucalypticola]
MTKALPLLLLATALAGCAHKADTAPAQPDHVPGKGGCYQSDWQAETAPVINKRLGPDGLEKYDTERQAPGQGCP